MPGEIDILVLFNTNAFFGWLYLDQNVLGAILEENSPVRSGAKHRRNKPPKYSCGWSTSSLIHGNIPILVQIICLLNYKCQGKMQ